MKPSGMRCAAMGLVFGLVLVGCGAGRTLVMEPPTERRAFTSATVEAGKDTVTMPDEYRVRLAQNGGRAL